MLQHSRNNGTRTLQNYEMINVNGSKYLFYLNNLYKL